jgi:hypothetical protein
MNEQQLNHMLNLLAEGLVPADVACDSDTLRGE